MSKGWNGFARDIFGKSSVNTPNDLGRQEDEDVAQATRVALMMAIQRQEVQTFGGARNVVKPPIANQGNVGNEVIVLSDGGTTDGGCSLNGSYCVDAGQSLPGERKQKKRGPATEEEILAVANFIANHEGHFSKTETFFESSNLRESVPGMTPAFARSVLRNYIDGKVDQLALGDDTKQKLRMKLEQSGWGKIDPRIQLLGEWLAKQTGSPPAFSISYYERRFAEGVAPGAMTPSVAKNVAMKLRNRFEQLPFAEDVKESLRRIFCQTPAKKKKRNRVAYDEDDGLSTSDSSASDASHTSKRRVKFRSRRAKLPPLEELDSEPKTTERSSNDEFDDLAETVQSQSVVGGTNSNANQHDQSDGLASVRRAAVRHIISPNDPTPVQLTTHKGEGISDCSPQEIKVQHSVAKASLQAAGKPCAVMSTGPKGSVRNAVGASGEKTDTPPEPAWKRRLTPAGVNEVKLLHELAASGNPESRVTLRALSGLAGLGRLYYQTNRAADGESTVEDIVGRIPSLEAILNDVGFLMKLGTSKQKSVKKEYTEQTIRLLREWKQCLLNRSQGRGILIPGGHCATPDRAFPNNNLNAWLLDHFIDWRFKASWKKLVVRSVGNNDRKSDTLRAGSIFIGNGVSSGIRNDDGDFISRSPALFDGIALIGESWNYLRIVHSVSISIPVLLKPVRISRMLKGSRSLRDFRYGWQIDLFAANDLQVSLLLCCRHDFIDYRLWQPMLTSTLVNAITTMRGSNSSVYRDIVRDRPAKARIRVIGCDVEEYGKVVSHMLKRAIAELHLQDPNQPEVVVRFVSIAWGHSCEFIKVSVKLRDILWNNVSECLVHVAHDFEKAESASFWRKSYVEGKFGRRANFEYAIAGFYDTGNFYFLASMNEANEGDLAVVGLKLYSGFGKHARANENMYKVSEVSKYLAKCSGIRKPQLKKARITEIARKSRAFSEMCGAAESYSQRILEYRSLNARAEVIVSVSISRGVVTEGIDVLEEVLEFAINFVDGYAFGNEQWFKTVRIEEMALRTDMILGGASKTIGYHVNRLIAWMDEPGDDPFIFGPDYCLEVASCEAVSSFILYGSAVSVRHIPAHCNELVRSLGLTYQALSDGGTDWEPPHWGFQFDSGGRLRYQGGFVLNALPENVYFPTSFSPRLARVMEKPNELWGICELLRDALIASALRTYGARGSKFRATTRCYHRYPNTKLIHVEEFIAYLYSSTRNLHRIWWSVWGILSEVLENPAGFLKLFANFLTLELLKESSAFVFPAVSADPLKSFSYIVVPAAVGHNLKSSLSIYKNALDYRFKYSCDFGDSLEVLIDKVMAFVPVEYWWNLFDIDQLFVLIKGWSGYEVVKLIEKVSTALYLRLI